MPEKDDPTASMWSQVRTELQAMTAGGNKTWNRFRLLTMYCRDCNEVMAQVMQTSQGLVIVHHKARPDKRLGTNEVVPLSLQENALRDKNQTVTLLRRSFQSVDVFCRCSRAPMRGSDFLDPIARGERKVIATPRRHNKGAQDHE